MSGEVQGGEHERTTDDEVSKYWIWISRGFFDNIGHELLMKTARKHTDRKWILLYVERWLKATAQQPDGILVQRDRGTPLGGVVSPTGQSVFAHCL